MQLEVLIYCHNFQRRLCWVLSCFHQQLSHGLDVLFNIATMPNNGDPRTEDVMQFFTTKGMKFKHTIYTDRNAFAYPSMTKNRQIQESDADWFMCHSCDHLIQKHHLRVVEEQIKKHHDTDRVLGNFGNFFTVDVDRTNTVVNEAVKKSMYVPDAFAFVEREFICDSHVKRNLGGLLLLRHQLLREKNNNCYIKPEDCHDRHVFNKGMKTRSDVYLKVSVGARRVRQLPTMIHLEHHRDKELGYHTEEQR